ncbi:MAG TPA: 16S rRNA (cytosine(1402)-N(4))-methyltransferase RsmH [bacterium]|nr:16S rRNA (cytosine(1402)-N(4))-methyltransferase RsmH [bacterium]
MEENNGHISVLLKETLEALDIRPDGVYADLTSGKGGGHSKNIVNRLEDGMLVCFDRDPEAAEALRRMFGSDSRVRVINENFVNLIDVWERESLPPADGIVIDLGISSQQLAEAERGFSFGGDGPLSMKYNPDDSGPDAADIVNDAAEDYLLEIFYRFGESKARRIVRKIAERREKKRIETTLELAGLVEEVVPRRGHAHPATRVFLALRATVNGELEAIEKGVPAAIRVLKPGGILCVISFHSTEDRLVKNILRRAARGCCCDLPPDECICDLPPEIELVNRRVITPCSEEIAVNARSRSSKLRIVKKI